MNRTHDISNKVVREGLLEEAAFKRRLEEWGGARHAHCGGRATQAEGTVLGRKKNFKGLGAAGGGREAGAKCAGREPRGQAKSRPLYTVTGLPGPFDRPSVTSSSLPLRKVSRQMRTPRPREGTGLHPTSSR